MPRKRGERSYNDLLQAALKQFYASKLLAKEANANKYTRCADCQEHIHRKSFHCPITHKNFAADQREDFRTWTKKASKRSKPIEYARHSNGFKVCKAILFDIEAAIPEQALVKDASEEARSLWIERLKKADNIRELHHCILDLEAKHDQTWMTPSFNVNVWRGNLKAQNTPQKVKNHLLLLDRALLYRPPEPRPARNTSNKRHRHSDEYDGSKRLKVEAPIIDPAKPGECDYCRRNILRRSRVCCKVCPSLKLCMECYSQGSEYGSHLRKHEVNVYDTYNEVPANTKGSVKAGAEESEEDILNRIGSNIALMSGMEPIKVYLRELMTPDFLEKVKEAREKDLKAAASGGDEWGNEYDVDVELFGSNGELMTETADAIVEAETKLFHSLNVAAGLAAAPDKPEQEPNTKAIRGKSERGREGKGSITTKIKTEAEHEGGSTAAKIKAGAQSRKAKREKGEREGDGATEQEGVEIDVEAAFSVAMCYFLGFGTDAEYKERAKSCAGLLKKIVEAIMAGGAKKGLEFRLPGADAPAYRGKSGIYTQGGLYGRVMCATALCYEFGYGTRVAINRAKQLYKESERYTWISTARLMILENKKLEIRPGRSKMKNGLASAFYLLGLACLGKGEIKEAANNFGSAAVSGSHSRAAYNLGVLLSNFKVRPQFSLGDFLPKHPKKQIQSRGSNSEKLSPSHSTHEHEISRVKGPRDSGKNASKVDAVESATSSTSSPAVVTVTKKEKYGETENAETETSHGSSNQGGANLNTNWDDVGEEESKGIPQFAECYSRTSDARAQYNFALALLEGRNGLKKDISKAKELLESSARKGHLKATYNLAHILTESQPGKAKKLYVRAAERGHVQSMYNLGLIFDREGGDGEDTKESKKEAFKWYSRAAQRGDTRAMYNLGVLYANGHVTGGKDVVRAKQLFRVSAMWSPEEDSTAMQSHLEKLI